MKRAATSAEVEAKKKEVEATLKITSQVAHDIRSPLMALGVVTQDLSIFPETHQSLIQGAVRRITDICNSLVQSRNLLISSAQKESTDSNAKRDLSVVLENVLTEKKMLYRERLAHGLNLLGSITGNDFETQIDTLEFSRVVSNLIDNAVESIEETGTVELHLTREKSINQFRITDDGKGIPEEVLKKLGREMVSFGKSKGLGLGLLHAHQTVHQWRGSLEIESVVGKGTQITVSFPETTSAQ